MLTNPKSLFDTTSCLTSSSELFSTTPSAVKCLYLYRMQIVRFRNDLVRRTELFVSSGAFKFFRQTAAPGKIKFSAHELSTLCKRMAWKQVGGRKN